MPERPRPGEPHRSAGTVVRLHCWAQLAILPRELKLQYYDDKFTETDKRIEGYRRENAAGERKAAKAKREAAGTHERTRIGHVKIRVTHRRTAQAGRAL